MLRERVEPQSELIRVIFWRIVQVVGSRTCTSSCRTMARWSKRARDSAVRIEGSEIPITSSTGRPFWRQVNGRHSNTAKAQR